MTTFICITCGTQFPSSQSVPDACPICLDERQYVNHAGQQWTTPTELAHAHRNVLRSIEPQLWSITTEPKFAIGQRALLVQTPAGNILWDCVSLIEQATIDAVAELGGLAAIALSHPHFYAAMTTWSQAFGGVPIYVHAADRSWVQQPDPALVCWTGETYSPAAGLTLIRCGGHFAGGSVLHWSAGADGQGALLTGDIIYPVADQRYVSFMYSYPNLIPLAAPAIAQIGQAIAPFHYDRIYGGWSDTVITADGQAVVERSVERYVAAIQGGYTHSNAQNPHSDPAG